MEVAIQIPSADEKCGEHFVYRDFFECSDTWKKESVDNVPKSIDTYKAIGALCTEILDPVWNNFGNVILTYGFSSTKLTSEIKKLSFPNITPSGDQHASHDINSKGNPICSRLGIAVDFYVAGVSSFEVASWIVKNTRFDRLYFYSPHRPFHVSIGPDNSQAIVWMNGYRGGRHQPRVMKKEQFLSKQCWC